VKFQKDFFLRPHMIVVLIALAGAIMIVFATRPYGAGLSPDSITYIGTARNIASGAGAETFDGSPLIMMPPFYPFLLASIERIVGTDPLTAAPILNAILFGSTLYLAGILLLKKTSVLVAAAATIFLMSSLVLVSVSLMAWSELPFIFLSVLFFYCLAEFRESAELKWLLLMSVALSLAILTRYMGLAFLPVALIFIVITQKNRLKALSWQIPAFLLITTTPILLWISRNHSIVGAYFGIRPPSQTSVVTNANYSLDVILKWFMPASLVNNKIILAVGLLMLINAFIFFGKLTSSVKETALAVAPFLLLAISYTGLTIITSSIAALDRIEMRLLSPVFIPIVIIGILLISSISLFKFKPKEMDVLISLIILVFVILQAQSSIPEITNLRARGNGYGSSVWKENELLQFVGSQEFTQDCAIYANDPYLVYIYANRTTKMPLISADKDPAQQANYLAQLKGNWPPEDNSCLVWVKNASGGLFYKVNELQQILDIREIRSFQDGSVYSMKKMTPGV